MRRRRVYKKRSDDTRMVVRTTSYYCKELVEEFTREVWVRSDPFLVLVFDNAVHVQNVRRVYQGNLDKGRMNTRQFRSCFPSGPGIFEKRRRRKEGRKKRRKKNPSFESYC